MARRRGNVVLAPISRWLLWSPWRLLGAIVAVLIVAGLLSAAFRSNTGAPQNRAGVTTSPAPGGELLPGGDAGTSATSSEPDPGTGSSTTSSAAATTPSTPAPTPAAAQDQAAATATAAEWTSLWARPTMAGPAWRAALRPLTYDDYMAQLATVDPSRIPATQAGPADPAVVSFAPGAARVRVPVSGGSEQAIGVTMIFYPMTTSGQWLVSAVTVE